MLDGDFARENRAHDLDVLAGALNGLPYDTPCQPSTTCGPDGPMPRMKRPPDSASSVIAVMAVAAGVRAGICMIPVPSRIFLVSAPIQASGVTASEP